MTNMLTGVVSNGTGACAAIPGYTVAGKTGTSRKAVNGGYSHGTMASFIGFAPAQHPRLAAIVVLDEPTTQYGGAAAAPVFADVMQFALTRNDVAPDDAGNTQFNAARATAALTGANCDPPPTAVAALHRTTATTSTTTPAHRDQPGRPRRRRLRQPDIDDGHADATTTATRLGRPRRRPRGRRRRPVASATTRHRADKEGACDCTTSSLVWRGPTARDCRRCGVRPVSRSAPSCTTAARRARDRCSAASGDRVADGHRFAPDAVAAGAVALLVEEWLPLDVPQARVPSVRAVLGPLAARFFGSPSQAMRVLGVTGTNGKTTTTYLLEAIARAAGDRTGVIGTVSARIGDRTLPAVHTTPEATELQAVLAAMRDDDVATVAMEVSSHALDQHRVDATTFAATCFTNLSHDHLDYHGSLDAYFEAKARLFTPEFTRRAAVHVGDEHGVRLARQAADLGLVVARFAVDDPRRRRRVRATSC